MKSVIARAGILMLGFRQGNDHMIEKRDYIVALFETVPLTTKDLLGGTYDELVRQRIAKTIEIEAPITRSLLLKRVANSLSIQKVGCRLEEYFGRMLEDFSALRDDEDGIEVYHRSGTDVEPFYRGDSRTIRYSVQIPPCEAAFALMDSLHLAGGRQKRAAAYAAFLDELGYQKSGKDLKRLFARALKWAVDNQGIRRMSNGTLMLTSF